MNVRRALTVNRLAARQLRRDWRSAVLLVVLLSLTLCVGVGYAVIASNNDLSLSQRLSRALGSSDARVTIAKRPTAPMTVDRFAAPGSIRAALGAGSVVSPMVEMQTSAATAGQAVGITLTLLEEKSPLVAPLYLQRAGRLPLKPGEVDVSVEVAERLGLGVGDTLSIPGFTQRQVVVGLVVDAVDTNSTFGTMTLTDRQLSQATSKAVPNTTAVSYLVKATPEQLTGSGLPYLDRQAVIDRANDSSNALAAALFGGCVFAVGAVALAGFLAISRRQRRTTGLLDLLGADRATRVAVTLMSTSGVAVTGCLLGVILGVAGGLLILPVLAARAHQVWQDARVPWPSVSLLAAVTVLVSLLVSLFVALSASRFGARQMIGSRDSLLLARVRGRPAGAAVAALIGGLTLLGSVLLLHSTGAAVLGSIVLALGISVLVVDAAAWLQDRTPGPFWLRMAGRNARRLPTLTRSITLGVTGIATMASLAAFLLSSLALSTGYIPVLPYGAAQFSSTQQLTPAAIAQARQTLGAAESVDYRVAWRRSPDGDYSDLQILNPLQECMKDFRYGPKTAEICAREVSFSLEAPRVAFIGTNELRVLLGSALSPAAEQQFKQGKAIARFPQLINSRGNIAVVTGASILGSQGQVTPGDATGSRFEIPSVLVSGSEEAVAAPAVLLPRTLLGQFGLVQATSWNTLFLADTPPTAAQEDTARAQLLAAAPDGQLTVDRGDPQQALARTVIAISASVLGATTGVLAIIFVTLSALQVRRESALLSSLGADRRIRRLIAATQAAVPVTVSLVVALAVGALGARAGVAIENEPWSVSATGVLLATAASTVALALIVGCLAAPKNPGPVRDYE